MNIFFGIIIIILSLGIGYFGWYQVVHLLLGYEVSTQMLILGLAAIVAQLLIGHVGGRILFDV